MAHELSITVERDGKHFIESSVEPGKVLEGPFKTAAEALRRSKLRSDEFPALAQDRSLELDMPTRLNLGGNGAAKPGVRETEATQPPLPTIRRKGGSVTPITVKDTGRITAETLQDDPFGSIGLLLQNFSAGIAGRKLPSDTLRESLAAQNKLEIDRFRLATTALKQAVELGENVPADQREAFITNYGNLAERAGIESQGFKDILRDALDRPDAKELFERASELHKPLFLRCGYNIKCLEESLQNTEFVKFAQEQADVENIPEIQFRLARIREVFESQGPATQQALGNAVQTDNEGKIVLTEANLLMFNKTAPPDMQLTPSMRATMARNPEILASQGFVLSGTALVAQKEAAKKAAAIPFEKPEIRAIEEKGKKFFVGFDQRTGEQKFKIAAGEKPSELSRLLREAGYTDAQAAEIRKGILEKRATITGRTPEDVKAARRAGKKGEFEAEEAEPIPTALVNLLDPLGQDPKLTTMTRGEARKQRVTIPQDVQIKDLQEAKASAMTATESAWELHEQAGREGAKILSGPGFVGRTFVGMRDAMIGFYELQGVKVSASTDPADYTSALSKAGIESAVMKSRVVDMAFALARRREGGRLTDQDVARAIETIGANTGSPAAFTKVLGDVVKRIDREYQIVVQATTNRRPTSLQDEREFRILAKGLDASTNAEYKSLSKDAKNRLRLIEDIREEQSR